jgi:hypothetical protein
MKRFPLLLVMSLTLASLLGARRASAFPPESCDADPNEPGRCDIYSVDKRCYRGNDAPGAPSGVCAASFGCSCVDPNGPGPSCTMSRAGGPAGSMGAAAVAIAGLAFAWGTRRRLRGRSA